MKLLNDECEDSLPKIWWFFDLVLVFVIRILGMEEVKETFSFICILGNEQVTVLVNIEVDNQYIRL